MAEHPAPGVRACGAAAAASLVLALGLCASVAQDPAGRLLGHPGNDVWNHAWGYGWVAGSLAQGALPLATRDLAWPAGGSLYFIDLAQATALAPLTWLAGPAVSYNLAMVLGLALSAFGAWLLAATVTGDAAASAVARVIYGASPHLLGQAYNGISETVCAGWFPLVLWALIRQLDQPSAGRALALGGLATACATTSWYYGLFAALAGGLIVVEQALRPGGWARLRRAGPGLLGAAALAAALVLPWLRAFRGSLDAPDALVRRDPAFVEASLLRHNLTDVLAMFRPGTTPSPDLHALFGEDLVIVVYLGWVGLLLAARAVLRGPWPERRVWLGVAGVFFLFSLGPYLIVDGAPLLVGGRKIPLPFLPLFDALPLFSRVSHPFRFVVGVSLALAVLAARGLVGAPRGLPAALAGLALVEVGLCSPATLPIPSADAAIPAASRALARDPVPGAVLDLPITLPNLERAVYLWYQTAHHRPVPWGLNEPVPAYFLENRLLVTLMRLEATRAHTPPDAAPALDLVLGARELRRLGLRAVVVHPALYPPWKLDQVVSVLDGVFGAPEAAGSNEPRVYLLDPLEALH